MIKIIENYDAEKINFLKKYLKERYEVKKIKNMNRLNIVFDIFKDCDLACIGCGTDANYRANVNELEMLPSKEQIFSVLNKIYNYKIKHDCEVFINYGGGEPFLRTDIIEILEYSYKLFGSKSIGIDTNGTLNNSYDLIKKASEYVSYIGISINGLKDYHNWWSGNNKIDAYECSINTLKKLCKHPEIVEILEVSSVATKKNYKTLPMLMEVIKNIGVKYYSIHRAMPVGRMAKHMDLIMDYREYLDLMISTIEKSHELSLDAHIHHSIESIYTSLLLDIDTHLADKVGTPDLGSSIGIEPDGNLVFDPWCTAGIWKTLSAGNLFDEDIDFEKLISNDGNSLFDLTNIYTAMNLRCKGCKKMCSGGSRVVAAAEKLNVYNENEITLNKILDAFTEVDPVCPLKYE